MSVQIFVPRDATALSLGANEIAQALTAHATSLGIVLDLVRNGSRGLCWLEPLIEVMTPQGRVAYGPVTPEDVGNLLDSGLLQGQAGHPLYLGLTAELPALKSQQRITFARAGITDPVSLADYHAWGGLKGLQRALTLSGQAIVDEVKSSGLRGRGGAAFPTGIKWQTVLNAPATPKYVVCNADEGDSGTFADRLVMESDPFMLIEGMLIAGIAVGAAQGYIYLRSEYPVAHTILEEAIAKAYAAGYLGKQVAGSTHTFDLEVRLGAEAYICGEETSLLESLEGKRGTVRPKPPLPALEGLFGKPTVVNNVLSFAAIPYIVAQGGAAYHAYGAGRSRGTLPFQLAGNIRQGGLFELPFGLTLRQLLNEFGGGTASGRPIRAVQVGGPLGAYLPESQFDLPLDYEAFAEANAVLGHGGVVVFDDSVDMLEQARFSMEFCAKESCGKCTPCRIGSVRGVEVIDRIKHNQERGKNMALLDELCDTLFFGSLCAMGGMTPYPVRSAYTHFPEDFNR